MTLTCRSSRAVERQSLAIKRRIVKLMLSYGSIIPKGGENMPNHFVHLMRPQIPVAFVACLMILALAASACGGAPSAAPTTAPGAALAATAAPAAATSAALSGRPTTAATAAPKTDSTTGNTTTAAAIDRRIIKNAQLTATVENVDVAIFRLTGIAADVGGYLVASRTFVEGNRKAAQVTIAVPVDRFEEALNLVRKTALRVENDTASSADVTEQYVDLQSRLRNLESTSARIREFLVKAQNVEEALKINAQLSEVDRQIEEIKGKLNAMTSRTTFSTIAVDLREPVPTPTPTHTPTATPTPTPSPTPLPIVWHPDKTLQTAVDTQTVLLNTLVRVVGDVLIWFTVVILPYLVVLALIVGGLRWVVGLFVKT